MRRKHQRSLDINVKRVSQKVRYLISRRNTFFVVILALLAESFLVFSIWSSLSYEEPIESMVLSRPYHNRPEECLYLNYMKMTDRTASRMQIDSRFFYKNFVSKNRPVVLVGALNRWPAISKWTKEYLRERIGDLEVKIAVGNKADRSFGIVEKTPKISIPFSKFVDLVDINNGTQYYLNLQGRYYSEKEQPADSVDIPNDYLRADWEMPNFMEHHDIREINFWMGPDEIVSRLHQDSSENLLCMVHGSKRFIIFPPNNDVYLYPLESGQVHFSQVDVENPDYEKFPLLKYTTPTECQVNAGDILFVPAKWWHQVQSRGSPNLAVNFWYETHSKIHRILLSIGFMLGLR